MSALEMLLEILQSVHERADAEPALVALAVEFAEALCRSLVLVVEMVLEGVEGLEGREASGVRADIGAAWVVDARDHELVKSIELLLFLDGLGCPPSPHGHLGERWEILAEE